MLCLLCFSADLDSQGPVKKAVDDACFRSMPAKIYPVKEVVLDYLPTLSAMDHAFLERQSQKWLLGMKEEVKNAVHIFEERNAVQVAIDNTELGLKYSVRDYTFSKHYQPLH
jgi:hypothetical protein